MDGDACAHVGETQTGVNASGEKVYFGAIYFWVVFVVFGCSSSRLVFARCDEACTVLDTWLEFALTRLPCEKQLVEQKQNIYIYMRRPT